MATYADSCILYDGSSVLLKLNQHLQTEICVPTKAVLSCGARKDPEAIR